MEINGTRAPISSNQDTRMEDLPEEVIMSIMTETYLRDVVNFSSVSKRWIHLPSFLHKIVLDSNMAKNPNQLCPHGGKGPFVNGVNQFLRYYKKWRNTIAPTISLRLFFISFCLTRDSSTDIDSWISMAILFGVKTLVVNLRCAVHFQNTTHRPYDEQYIFPWQLLDQYPTVLKDLCLRDCLLRCHLTSKLTSLEILRVCTTTVTECDMDRITQCCPNLRTFVLVCCKVPAKLLVKGCDSLTCLKLLNCHGLEEIEVLSGRALTEFTYKGKLDFPAMRCLSVYRRIKTLPPLLHLHGRMTSFLRLEELKLYIYPDCSFSLATVKEMLIACPVLKRLEMVPPCTLDDVENAPVHHLHKCLRFINIRGFCGGWGSVELAKFLVQASEALQHVVIEL